MIEPDELQADEGQAIAARVREVLARRRISRQAVADMARISLSTLEKALSGSRSFTLASVIRLEDALGTPLRTAIAPSDKGAGLAPESMGAYARAAVRWIEGTYLTLRPSFGAAGDIYAYWTTIHWDDTAGYLCFAESGRIDSQFAQVGHVSMPNLSGHIYLVTNDAGQYRMSILGRATREGRLYGILTTLQVGVGSQLVPVSCPIALLPESQHPGAATGLMPEGAEEHATYDAILKMAVAGDFARFKL